MEENYINQQLVLEITKEQVEMAIKEEKNNIYHEFEYFNIKDVIQKTLQEKETKLKNNIDNLTNRFELLKTDKNKKKDKNKENVITQIKKSEISLETIKNSMQNIDDIAKKEKSNLQ